MGALRRGTRAAAHGCYGLWGRGHRGPSGRGGGGGKAAGKSPPRWPGRSGFPGHGRTGTRRWNPPGRELAPTRSVAVESLQQLGGFDPCAS